MDANNYIKLNRESWNNRVEPHLKSEFYNLESFLKGKNSLNEIELNLLGGVKGKSILHLQCHFGQDSISLSRLGAKVTGIDLSDKSIEKAKELAIQTNSDAQFICCDLYDLPNYLEQKFDFVFSSYGTIVWLPDLDKWAKVISQFLKPTGKFVFAEFHPVVWMFDDEFEKIGYNYFNVEALVENQSGTYADKSSNINTTYVMWNHGIGEVLNSLISNNLILNSFDEFDYSPYNCFNKTIKIAPDKYRIEHLNNKIPMVYAIVATKKEAY